VSKLLKIAPNPLTVIDSARIIGGMVQKRPHFSVIFAIDVKPALSARGLALCALPPVGGFR
jgi:hypothetical protein